jgi:hypothetical protein
LEEEYNVRKKPSAKPIIIATTVPTSMDTAGHLHMAGSPEQAEYPPDGARLSHPDRKGQPTGIFPWRLPTRQWSPPKRIIVRQKASVFVKKPSPCGPAQKKIPCYVLSQFRAFQHGKPLSLRESSPAPQGISTKPKKEQNIITYQKNKQENRSGNRFVVASKS